MGLFFTNKKEEKVNYDYYLQLAQEGDANAQFKIGVYYDKGKGVAQDLSKSVEWYTKAAAQGHEKAQAKLTECSKIM